MMTASRTILLIMAAVLAWGVFHAIGAYRLNHNPLRIVVVLGCVLAFLGFWAAMLASRSARLRRDDKPSDEIGA
jgi:protein-S-isoprenylcysteine O-methyltransferase Ste14